MTARKPKRTQLDDLRDTLADLTTEERVDVAEIQRDWSDENIADEIYVVNHAIASRTRRLRIMETLQAIRTLTGSLTAACAAPVTADPSEQQPTQTAQSAADAAG